MRTWEEQPVVIRNRRTYDWVASNPRLVELWNRMVTTGTEIKDIYAAFQCGRKLVTENRYSREVHRGILNHLPRTTKPASAVRLAILLAIVACLGTHMKGN